MRAGREHFGECVPAFLSDLVPFCRCILSTEILLRRCARRVATFLLVFMFGSGLVSWSGTSERADVGELVLQVHDTYSEKGVMGFWKGVLPSLMMVRLHPGVMCS